MRSAKAVGSGLPPIEAIGARTLALRPSVCRRVQRHLIAPFLRVDPLRWRNTTRGVRLFVRASFSGLSPERVPERPDDHLVSALFVFGAIDLAGDLAQLPPIARRRIELVFLRRAYGVGRFCARRLRRVLHERGRTARGRVTLREGRTALLEWFDGLDPSHRLRDQIERAPGVRLDLPRRRPVRVRRPERQPVLARARWGAAQPSGENTFSSSHPRSSRSASGRIS